MYQKKKKKIADIHLPKSFESNYIDLLYEFDLFPIQYCQYLKEEKKKKLNRKRLRKKK